MKLIDYKQELWDSFMLGRRISKPAIEQSFFERFLRNMDALNALPRHARKFNDIPLEDIVIDTRFKQFILPESVTLTSAYEDEDYLFREASDITDSDKFLETDFMKVVRMLGNTYKLPEPKVSKLTDFRKDLSLSSEAKHNFSVVVSGQWMTSGRLPANTMPIPLVIRVLDVSEFSMYQDIMIDKVIVQMFDEVK